MNDERKRVADEIIDAIAADDLEGDDEDRLFADAWMKIKELPLDEMKDDDEIVVEFGEDGEFNVKVTQKEKDDE